MAGKTFPKKLKWPEILADARDAGMTPGVLARRVGVARQTVVYAEKRCGIRLLRTRARRGKPQPSVRRPRAVRVPDLFVMSARQRQAWDARLAEAFAQCRT